VRQLILSNHPKERKGLMGNDTIHSAEKQSLAAEKVIGYSLSSRKRTHKTFIDKINSSKKEERSLVA
jgi:hypothetical protein